MREVVVVSAVRTPVGKSKKGSLKDTRPDELLGLVLKSALERGGVDPAVVDDVVVGTAMPEAEQGMNVARIGGFLAGLPDEVPALTINRFCSSGLQSIAQGASAILAGWQDVVLAGGVESMSLIAMGGEKPAPNPKLMAERPETYTPMGITAENVASQFGVSREDQDAFALRSHERALAAQAEGRFADELVPVPAKVFVDGAWTDMTVAADEGPRASTIEGLAKLKPAFKQGGSVTAGNSSQTSDGAAAVVIASRERAEREGWPVLGVLKSYQVAGVPPEIMGIGPVKAIPKAVASAGLKLEDIGLFEINEAFAAQAVYCVRELGIDPEKVNVNGGAIALGHPLGCTGAKLTATLLHEMKRRGIRYGVVSMCIGGGMGAAAVFENPSAA
ncbi:MAG: acetyl-CoA C-acyltransferase [Alphaproteobacteria bacterium]|nr:acetyl-CoA C-acyltransferase [Alphaproteobacteria bacterium]